jgi:hypothetical protein
MQAEALRWHATAAFDLHIGLAASASKAPFVEGLELQGALTPKF